VNTLRPRRSVNDDLEMDDGDLRPDREITLGTSMILAIFFGLAVLCAGFFGFGYQVGHRSAVVPPPVAAVATNSGTDFSGFKPAAGSPLANTTDKPATASAPDPAATVLDVPSPAADPTSDAPSDPPHREPAANNGVSVATASNRATPLPATRPTPSAAVVPSPVPASPGAIVQIAAVSHQEDADLLVTELKRRGYNVSIRTEAQDKLLHVQIGPLPTHKDADAMRQRLLNDGFNAIVKDTK